MQFGYNTSIWNAEEPELKIKLGNNHEQPPKLYDEDIFVLLSFTPVCLEAVS